MAYTGSTAVLQVPQHDHPSTLKTLTSSSPTECRRLGFSCTNPHKACKAINRLQPHPTQSWSGTLSMTHPDLNGTFTLSMKEQPLQTTGIDQKTYQRTLSRNMRCACDWQHPGSIFEDGCLHIMTAMSLCDKTSFRPTQFSVELPSTLIVHRPCPAYLFIQPQYPLHHSVSTTPSQRQSIRGERIVALGAMM